MPSLAYVAYVAGAANDADAKWYSSPELGIPVEISFSTTVMPNRTNPYTDTYPLIVFGDTWLASAPTVKEVDNFIGYILGPSAETDTTVTARPSALLASMYKVTADQLPDILNFKTQQIPRSGDPKELRVTPVSGISIRSPRESALNIFVISYVSVTQEGEDDWKSAYSGFAVSTTTLKPLSKQNRLLRFNNSDYSDPWQQIAFTRKTIFDEYVYMFGTTNGRRSGPLKLSRVRQERLLDMTAYPSPLDFWDGNSWVNERSNAITVFNAPISNLSVMWHQKTNQWLMMYFNTDKKALVLRKAPELWGSWSAEETLATQSVYTGLKSMYFLERTSNFTTPWVCISRSGFPGPYLMKLTL